jgi:hypothetical protein
MVPAGPGLTGWSPRDITAVAGHAVNRSRSRCTVPKSASPATVTRTYPVARQTWTVSALSAEQRMPAVSALVQPDGLAAPLPAPLRSATISHESSPPANPVSCRATGSDPAARHQRAGPPLLRNARQAQCRCPSDQPGSGQHPTYAATTASRITQIMYVVMYLARKRPPLPRDPPGLKIRRSDAIRLGMPRSEQGVQQQPVADRAEQRGDRVGGAPAKTAPRPGAPGRAWACASRY